MVEKEDVLNNPATSYWLKDLIESGSKRDILDVLYDLMVAKLVFEAEFEKHYEKVRMENGENDRTVS